MANKRLMGNILKIKTMVIGPDLFFPENKNGVNKTTFNILKNNPLLEGDFFYPERGAASLVDMPEGFDWFKVHPIAGCGNKSPGLVGKISSLISPRPFICEPRSTSKSFYNSIKNKTKGYDLIIIFSLNVSDVTSFFTREELSKTVLVAIDCLSFFYDSRIAQEKNIIKKLVFKWDQFKAKSFEKKLYSRLSRCLFVSPKDAEYGNKLSGKDSCSGVPYGVNVESLNSEYNGDKFSVDKIKLIFTGNFDYGPNITGALFLVNEVLPILKKEIPNVEIVLAGGNPVEEVRILEGENVRVTGFVKSLVDEISSSQIFLSPIFFGAGVKTKVLEAMFLERIVVGTPESFYAIEGSPDSEFLTVNDKYNPAAWAEIIANAIGNNTIPTNAKKSILENHTWENSQKIYNDYFKKSPISIQK